MPLPRALAPFGSHQRVSISNRCGDIDQEMVRHLGVSKAILSNVIFCHQEDSLWPLWESSRLKPIFDDIFAASRSVPNAPPRAHISRPTSASCKRTRTCDAAGAHRYSAALDQIKEVQKQCAEKLKEADFRLETAKSTCEEARSVRNPAHDARPPPSPPAPFPARRLPRPPRSPPAPFAARPLPDPPQLIPARWPVSRLCAHGLQRRNQATDLHARIQSSEGDRQTIQAQVARAEDTIRRLNDELASIDAVRRRRLGATLPTRHRLVVGLTECAVELFAGDQIEKERQTKRDLRQVKVDQAEGLQRQLGDEQFQGAGGSLGSRVRG